MNAGMGPAEYSRHLRDRYGIQRSRQAIHKDRRLPRLENGRIDVVGADAALVSAGVIPRSKLEGYPSSQGSDPEGAPPLESGGRPLPGGPTYYDEKAQTERILRRIKEIELDELLGKTIAVERVVESMTACGHRLAEVIGTLPSLADAVTAAAKNGDVSAVRDMLRIEARKIREAMTTAMRIIESQAGEEDDDDGDDGNAAASGIQARA